MQQDRRHVKSGRLLLILHHLYFCVSLILIRLVSIVILRLCVLFAYRLRFPALTQATALPTHISEPSSSVQDKQNALRCLLFFLLTQYGKLTNPAHSLSSILARFALLRRRAYVDGFAPKSNSPFACAAACFSLSVPLYYIIPAVIQKIAVVRI